VTPETSLTLQILLGIDETAIQEWFLIVKRAYPQMEGEFYPRFLGIAMGGLKTAYESGWTAEQWIANTHRINGIA
jgi:hypothetical protein